MTWELVTTLPQGSHSRTLLARRGEQVAVLRATEFEPLLKPLSASPAVLPLRELAVVAGAHYAVFDLVPGLSLREVIDGLVMLGRPPPVDWLCTVVLHAARALATVSPPRAHGGLGSRALLIGCDGVTRVLDFGSPRLTRFQLGVQPTLEGDVFALGAVLHSALTGFAGHYGECVSRGLTLAGPSAANPDVPPLLDEVVLRALSVDPAARQPTVAQFAEALEAATAGLLLTPEQVAHRVHAMLARRQAWLDEVLAGGAGGAAAGDARPPGDAAAQTLADERTHADHLGPGGLMQSVLEQALAATALSVEYAAPTTLVPATAPFETQPSPVPQATVLEDTLVSRTELVPPHDSAQSGTPVEPSEQPTVVQRPPTESGRAPQLRDLRNRRRARTQDLVPTAPLDAAPMEPPVPAGLSKGALIALGLGLGALLLGLGVALVLVFAPGLLTRRPPPSLEVPQPVAAPLAPQPEPQPQPAPTPPPSEAAADRIQVDAGELNVELGVRRAKSPKVKKQSLKKGSPAKKPKKKKHRSSSSGDPLGAGW